MSDCDRCWNTPCTCGHDYKNWSEERLSKQIKMLYKVLKAKQKGIEFKDIDDLKEIDINNIDIILRN
jgi:hypothetical protein